MKMFPWLTSRSQRRTPLPRGGFAPATITGLVAGLAAAACGGSQAESGASASSAAGSYEWDLPDRFPLPHVPDENPMTREKVELGRYLFYDERLSGNGTQSCATCHEQARGFTEPRAFSVGSTGEVGPRNSLSLANVAYNSTLTWANPVLVTLEEQILVPMFGEDPLELAITGSGPEVLERLRSDATYQQLYREAFPALDEPLGFDSVVDALACFLRSMISSNSAYDRHVTLGSDAGFGQSEQRGSELFFSERLECLHCHGGFNLSVAVDFVGLASPSRGFFNTGLYNIDGRGGYPAGGRGLFESTGDARDMGKFRPPTLRNIALTAPYFHDGSAQTLEEVIQAYADGGRNIESGKFAGDGRASPLKSGFMVGFTLTDRERADLLAFLESLTDTEFATDLRFANPFAK